MASTARPRGPIWRSQVDLRRMTIFLAVVDNGSFSAAGEGLSMSQPAVSQAIRELESELGTALFYRLGRNVPLTPAGEALVEPARQCLRDAENGRTAVEQVAGLGGGRLDLACQPALVAAPLAPLVGAFRAAYPDVTITLADPRSRSEILRLVSSGACEIGVIDRVPVSGLRTLEIGTEDFLVVFPPGSRQTGNIPLADLAGVPLVSGLPGQPNRVLLEQAFQAVGAVPTVRVESGQRDAVLSLVISGAGVGFLPRSLAELGARLGCVVAEPEPPLVRPVVLVHREGTMTPAAHAFVDLAGEWSSSHESPEQAKRLRAVGSAPPNPG